MIAAIDFDGTITGNVSFYQQLMLMMLKSGWKVIVLTGCNPSRRKEVYKSLEFYRIPYSITICRPKSVKTGPSGLGEWKKSVLESENVDIWFDNEVKNYEDAGVDFSKLKVKIIRA